jgi:hypothetical protein
MAADELLAAIAKTDHDDVFHQQMLRLHRLTVYARWSLVSLLWLTVAPICLWELRSEIQLWLSYFTWSAIRYGLAYHRFATFGLALCIGLTISVLLWQSRNILFGVSDRHLKRLEKQVAKIRQRGVSHPLWKWVCRSDN